jgi:CRP-like cAMP-binding protein
MKTELLTYFRQIGIEEKDLHEFTKLLKVKTFKSGEMILQLGKTDNHLSFLSKGIVRFYVDKNGNDTTFDFIFANSFYCHYDSFYSRKPTQFYSEALTDTEILYIDYNSLNDLFTTCEFAKDLTRKAVEKLLEKKVKRELSLLTNTPTERYLNLLQEQPKLLQQIPQKYLATYLGIVPETLSRIRKRIS